MFERVSKYWMKHNNNNNNNNKTITKLDLGVFLFSTFTKSKTNKKYFCEMC